MTSISITLNRSVHTGWIHNCVQERTNIALWAERRIILDVLTRALRAYAKERPPWSQALAGTEEDRHGTRH